MLLRFFVVLSLLLAPTLGHAIHCGDAFASFSAEWLAAGQFQPADFHQIPFSSFKDVQQGRPSQRLFTATLDGKTVVGKRATFGRLKEAAWLRELNKLGLGVRLQGLTRGPDGDFFFVMEHMPGINTNQPTFGPLKKSAFLEMRRQFDVLAEHKVLPVDLQFQVTRDGRVAIVDPEYFEIRDGIFSRSHIVWRGFEAALKSGFELED